MTKAIRAALAAFLFTALLLMNPFRAFAGTVPILPDSTLTPGAVMTVDSSVVCHRSTKTVRHVTEAAKLSVIRSYESKYGVTYTHPYGKSIEIDHLVSLELGGSNAPSNLWPQPYTGTWNARVKDRLENKLHALVCSGALTLPEAQTAISINWISAYQRYVGGQP